MNFLFLKAAATFAKILDDFLCRNDDIILYVPLNLDGREKERLRLFDIWWNANKKYVVCKNLEKDRIEFKYETEQDVIVAVMYRPPQRLAAVEILYKSIPAIRDQSK